MMKQKLIPQHLRLQRLIKRFEPKPLNDTDKYFKQLRVELEKRRVDVRHSPSIVMEPDFNTDRQVIRMQFMGVRL